MDVACAVTGNFLPHCAAMLDSLLARNTPDALRIYLMHDGIDTRQLRIMKDFVTASGATLEFLQPDGQLPGELPATQSFSRAAWFRVLLPYLLPRLTRVLYLDIDAIVADSLAALWTVDLKGRLIAAVTNPLYPSMSERPMRELGIDAPSDYFNSGVMVMDLARMREEHVPQKVLAYAQHHPRLARYADQDPLNAILHKKRLSLHPRWNVQTTLYDLKPTALHRSGLERQVVREALDNPAIIHFSGPWKPWQIRCSHPRRALYDEHRARTPWPVWEAEGRTFTNRLVRHIPNAWQVSAAVFAKRIRRVVSRWS